MTYNVITFSNRCEFCDSQWAHVGFAILVFFLFTVGPHFFFHWLNRRRCLPFSLSFFLILLHTRSLSILFVFVVLAINNLRYEYLSVCLFVWLIQSYIEIDYIQSFFFSFPSKCRLIPINIHSIRDPGAIPRSTFILVKRLVVLHLVLLLLLLRFEWPLRVKIYCHCKWKKLICIWNMGHPMLGKKN